MEIFITSIIAFVSTNMDDIFILTLFYGNKKIKGREIVTGQLLGIMSLIAVSLVGSLVGLIIDQAYIGLLGLIPLYLGIKGIWEIRKHQADPEQPDLQIKDEGKNYILTVAGVTFANGGDNIGIYIPLFATLTWANKTVMIIVFLIMTLLWCLTAKYLTKHPYVSNLVDKYGHRITPFVLVLLGFYILYESKTLELLVH